MSDERLATLVHRGDDSAFSTLYERYREPLSRYCRSIIHDGEDARDAQQSTMVSALRALRSRPLDGRVKPWLYRIAHNESINVLRRRRSYEPLDDQTPAPGIAQDRLENWESLVADLRSLPERQRAALLMHELSGLKYDEIGLALSVTPVAARKSVFEARAALAETAAGRDTDCEEIRIKISDRDGRVLRARRVRGHLDSCASCSAFQRSMTERRRVLGMVPALPGSAAGLAGAGLGVAGYGSGAGASGAGLASGVTGVAISGGATSAAAIKGIAMCALCAMTGAGVMISRAQEHSAGKHPRSVTLVQRPHHTATGRAPAAERGAAVVHAPSVHRVLRHSAVPSTPRRQAAHRATGAPTLLHRRGHASGVVQPASSTPGPGTTAGSVGAGSATSAGTGAPTAGAGPGAASSGSAGATAPPSATTTPATPTATAAAATPAMMLSSAERNLITTLLDRVGSVASAGVSAAESQLQTALAAGTALTNAERSALQLLLGQPGSSTTSTPAPSTNPIAGLIQKILAGLK
ncbi:MAG TPA: sigma-70 family RNA polymerase sigma factor [Solirubrobacteraceae bacterium]|nr:sigma-70 family RNA polymerase sigma factor [Solirubrobacteraceae bacterium]